MTILTRVMNGCMILATVLAASGNGLGQIQLPGGIKIGGLPRQTGRIPLPGTRPERPDPDRVCPAVVAWMQILQNEYPGIDLAHTVSGKVQQMAVPLFADEAFQKQFGVSYPRLSDAERREFFRTHLIPCQTSRQYSQQTILIQVFNPPFQPGTAGMGPLSPGQLIPALARLEGARSTLRADQQKLQSAPASADTYDQAANLQNQRKEELALVWPGEKARFEGAVREAVSRSASAAVEAKIQPLLNAPASPQAANQLREAPRTYSALFQAVPGNQRAALEKKLDERHSAMLQELLPAQQSRGESFAATRQGLDDGAEWFRSFQSLFLQPPPLPEADAVAKAYLARREAALARMAPQFRQKIESAQEAGNVSTLYDDVFRLPEDRQTGTWQDLAALRTARAKLLTERAEQAARAAQEREERAALARGEVVLSSLKLGDLQNASLFRNLYTGTAASEGLSRTNILFTKMFESYLIEFGRSCRKVLPANAVQMTYQECGDKVQTTIVSGYYVNTSTDCLRWDTKNYEGAFADPRSYRAQKGAEKLAELSYVQSYMKQVFTNPLSIFSNLGDTVLSKETIEQDIPQLIEQNGCSSKALARLQENMTRLALDQDPLHLPGYQPDRTHTTLASDLDISDLANDLIRADATTWIMNHYQGLNGAGIVGDLDAAGRPRRVHATYSQKGVSPEGSVDIAFTDGTPACLYFADAPASCKPPSPSVVKQYKDGVYRKRNGR